MLCFLAKFKDEMIACTHADHPHNKTSVQYHAVIDPIEITVGGQ